MAIDLAHVGRDGVDPDQPDIPDFGNSLLKLLQVFLQTEPALSSAVFSLDRPYNVNPCAIGSGRHEARNEHIINAIFS